MNFTPELAENKTYVGPLPTDYQQTLSDDISQKTTTLGDCYEPLATFGTSTNSPSASTEFKRTDTRFEDLDTNADTTSLPDSEFVPEYFDIYGSNESLNKAYTTLASQPKWGSSFYPDKPSKDVDTTTTTTTTSETGFKLTPFHSGTLFFEDDFRYVTSRQFNGNYQAGSVSDLDKNDPYTPQANYSLTPYKLSEPSKDFYQLPQATKDDLMDKAELASTSFAQITNTMANFSANSSNAVANTTMVGSLTSPGLFSASHLNSNLVSTNLVPTSLPTNLLGPYDIKRPSLFFNGPLYNMNAPMDADIYLSPTLYNKSYNLVYSYPVSTNYCVYVGADYNKLVCTCNLNRPNGSNSHSTNCNVVAGGVELSTESWPIAKASQMYSLINTWDRIIKNYKRCSNKSDTNSFYLPEDYKPPFYSNHVEEDKALRANLAAATTTGHLKNANNLISEITGIKINLDNSDQFSLRNAVSEHLRSDEVTKRRKTSKKTAENHNPVLTREVDLSGLGAGTDDDSKLDKKEMHQQNSEKVSGVWYDTNRHLWRVVYMKGNKRKTQGFSSLKLGYEEARRKAIQMRHEMVAMRHSDRI